ncbi:MAG: preprotein translocase subunit SecA [Candidatus Eisenbacteria bacterium]|nr:preprotein translocase subunit SecA [Candidatus Eisenbacteria bacterium]
MFDNLLKQLFGSRVDREMRRLGPDVDRINGIWESYRGLSDEALAAKTTEFRERLAAGETPDDLMHEAFAAAKEACSRLMGKTWDVVGLPTTWEMVPFDVQLMGAIVLHRGGIAEMATGEGKTLVATMPLYLNALSGKGAHLVTVNDYLARRDAEWMGKVYETLGLSVGCIQTLMTPEERRVQYAADITYGTNNEFGFDYLRDNMAVRLEDRVQRGHNYAIVDEVDSVLIDEARTPLIISGVVEQSTHMFDRLKPPVERLVRRQAQVVNSILDEAEKLTADPGTRREGLVKLVQASRGAPKHRRLMRLYEDPSLKTEVQRVETELMRDKLLTELDEDLLFAMDERGRNASLTEKGRDLLSPEERNLLVLPDLSEQLAAVDADGGLSDAEKAQRKNELHMAYAQTGERIHNVQALLKAYSLFEKNVDYVVQDGKVLIVDEFTGRLMPGRRWSDGLHQAVEAKEGVEIERETQTLATITLQNYFRMYGRLAGMTGTAETEEEEFGKIYTLSVHVVPTNEPVRRVDYDDRIYRTRREKFAAVLDEIARLHERKQPVLVGTVTVEVSEVISRMLKARRIEHSVLNARHHQREAEIVAAAGRAGAVTIATNMAGRGTDIKLGPGVLRCEKCCVKCVERDCARCDKDHDMTDECLADMPCGLRIVGTERHESRRIDRQLRGRSGRQGDPGSSQFFIALEDDLMRIFGSERIARVMTTLGVREGDVIEHPLVTKAIERAQKRVELHNFDIRKHLLEYDDVMNQQRTVIYAQRLNTLEGGDLSGEVAEICRDIVERKVRARTDGRELPEQWDLEGLRDDLRRVFLVDIDFRDADASALRSEALVGHLQDIVATAYARREADLTPEIMRRLERIVFLQVIDRHWRDHLYELDRLKEGIGLRAYGQKDPLLEYKSEAFSMFMDLVESIQEDAVQLIFRAQVAPVAEAQQRVTGAQAHHPDARRAAAPPAGQRPSTTPLPEFAPGVPSGGRPAQRDFGAPPPRRARSEEGAEDEGPRPEPVRRAERVGRNDPCPCGSGRKYKKCCGRDQ